MILKYLYLTLNRLEYPDELTLPFSFYTRYVCNFLERKIRPLKWRATGFDRICVEGCKAPKGPCEIVPDHTLRVPVSFAQHDDASVSPADVHELFLGMLTAGFEKCAASYGIPADALLAGIQEFRDGGYRNQWTHKTKLLRSVGLRATMLCALTPERFTLRLQLERQAEVVFDQIILETLPDELIYTHMFKDVIASDGKIVVQDRSGKDLAKVDPKDMLLIRCIEPPTVTIPKAKVPLADVVKMVSTLDD